MVRHKQFLYLFCTLLNFLTGIEFFTTNGAHVGGLVCEAVCTPLSLANVWSRLSESPTLLLRHFWKYEVSHPVQFTKEVLLNIMWIQLETLFELWPSKLEGLSSAWPEMSNSKCGSCFTRSHYTAQNVAHHVWIITRPLKNVSLVFEHPCRHVCVFRHFS